MNIVVEAERKDWFVFGGYSIERIQSRINGRCQGPGFATTRNTVYNEGISYQNGTFLHEFPQTQLCIIPTTTLHGRSLIISRIMYKVNVFVMGD